MARPLKLLSLLTIAATLSIPCAADAQDYRWADEARHDRKANEGFSTSRTTAGSDRGGQVRYTLSNDERRSRRYSTAEADKQFSRGQDAYAAGQYSAACRAFCMAKNFYKRAGEDDRTNIAATLATDACATARYNGAGRASRWG